MTIVYQQGLINEKSASHVILAVWHVLASVMLLDREMKWLHITSNQALVQQGTICAILVPRKHVMIQRTLNPSFRRLAISMLRLVMVKYRNDTPPADGAPDCAS